MPSFLHIAENGAWFVSCWTGERRVSTENAKQEVLGWPGTILSADCEQKKVPKGKTAGAFFPIFPFQFSSGSFPTLIIERGKNANRGVENFLVHLAVFSDSFGQRNGHNLVSAQG